MASYFQNLKRSCLKAGVIHEINRWCTINKLISKSVSDSPAAKPQFDLPIPFDPEVKFVNVQVENLGVASVDHIRAGYTDENPNGSPTVITVHGCPGKSLLVCQWRVDINRLVYYLSRL